MTEETTKQTPEIQETMDDYQDELEASCRPIREGDILTGTVIAVSEANITLDLKYYTDGIIHAEDLSSDPNFKILQDIHIGDEITATVIRRDDGEGHIVLSKKEANDLLAWDKLREYQSNRTVLSVKIGGIVNKGVITYVEGIRGFIPASKLDVNFVEDTEQWLNKTVDAIVITVKEEEKKLVLSAKEPAMEKLAAETNKKIAKVAVGSVMNGTVESIQSYGAFIELENGLSGLLHISQISEKRISHPSAVLKQGQAVKVKIISTENGKIGLSIKALADVSEPSEEILDYELPKGESIGTSLGSLLKGLKL
ncbi:MAG: S1 RNA-binding domain-containing protein [Lachnospiraceae bacterium]|nr:S1 RNA-binding domain-containing protein [Lachnospiraceae bacterium]